MKKIFLLLVLYLSAVGAFAQLITGPSAVCTGSTITLTDASPGSWVSSNPAMASIGSGTGIITGIAAGVVTITYNFSIGGSTTYPVTVYPTPAPISGPTSVCVGSTIALSDITAGGTWSTSSSCAIVSPAGVVTGITAGCVAIITYGNTGCYVTQAVTVNAAPAAITGTRTICGTGGTTTLADATPGGTFNGGGSCVSVVAGTGVCTGISTSLPCTGLITYTLPDGCYSTATVTVYPVPVLTVTGTQVRCSDANTAPIIFTSTVTGTTYSWTNSNPSIGLAASGTGSLIPSFTAVNTGTTPVVATITITPSANGCPGLPQSVTVTVNPLPPLCTVTGGGVCCPGGSGVHVGLSCSTPGISYQLYCGTSTVGAPVTGTGSAIDFGAFCTACTYTVVAINTVTGCSSTMTGSAIVTLGALPPLCNVTGGGFCCAGSSGVHVGLSCSSPGINYQLYCGTTIVGAPLSGSGAPLDFGLFCTNCVYKVVATNATTGCSDTMNGSVTVTVAPLPVVYNVTGGGNYCDSSFGCPHIGLSGSQVGVTYKVYCGTALITSRGGTGVALDFGTQCSPCTYTITATDNTTGCTSTMSGSASVTNILPAPITGATTIACPSTTTTLADATPAGVWSSLTPSCGTISTTGVVTATNPGPGPCTATIKYLISPGCFVTTTVTIPYCGPVIGPRDTTSCCVDSIKVNTGYDPVTNSAVVPGLDCGAPVKDPKWIVTYEDPAIAASLISNPICTGEIEVTSGGSADVIGIGFPSCWATNPKSSWISCVNNSQGFTTIGGIYTYHTILTRPFTMCKADLVNVNLQLAYDNYILSTNIDGTSFYSSGVVNNCSTASFHTTSTTVFLSAGTHYLNVDLYNYSAAYNISPNSMGLNVVGTIKSADDSGSFVNENKATHCCCEGCEITGNTHICAGGTTTLSSCSSCVWSSSNTSVATIGSCTGVVTGISGGTVTITHVSDIGCSTFITVTVDALPTVCTVTGGGPYCIGTTCPHVFLGCSQVGVNYQLSCGSTLVTPLLAGTGSALDFGPECGPCTYTVKATNTIGCTSTMSGSATSTPNSPCPILGTVTSMCVGDNLTMITGSCSPVPSCPWSSSNTSVATVNCSGVVSAVAAGVVIISYTTVAGCVSTYTITVNPSCPISGTLSICAGGSTTLTTCCIGGVWSSSNPACIVVNPATGVCTSLSAPCCSRISYTTMAGCISYATVCSTPVPTVTPNPVSICLGTSVTLNPTPSGGTWTGTPCVSMTPVGSTSSRVITGLFAPCVGSVTYSVGGCSVNVPVTVNAACPITGPLVHPHTVCSGSSIVLATTCVGGTWSSSNPTCVSVNPISGVCTGGTTGTIPCSATITYTSAGGCTSTYTVTNNPVPTISATTLGYCTYMSYINTLTATGGPGTWSTSGLGHATPISTTSPITGVNANSPGTEVFYYTNNTTGCFAQVTVTVYPIPTINVPPNVCVGSSVTCTVNPTGGTFGLSSGCASITSAGVLTGISGLCTEYITYNKNGCITFGVVTVNPLPIASGPSVVCVGSSISETELTGMNCVWSLIPSSPYASLSSFLGTSTNINGLSAGSVTLKAKSLAGCISYKPITVNAPPVPGVILWSPSNIVCVGGTINFANWGGATPGGTWSTSCSLPYATMTPGVGGGTILGDFWGWWPFSHSCILTYTTPNVPGCGTRSVSNTYTVELCKHKGSTAGDETDVLPATELKVFPNPNQGSFTVNLQTDKNESAEVKVTNVIGETIKKFTTVTNKDNMVQIDNAPGIYMVSVTTANGNYVAKVVVE